MRERLYSGIAMRWRATGRRQDFKKNEIFRGIGSHSSAEVFVNNFMRIRKIYKYYNEVVNIWYFH